MISEKLNIEQCIKGDILAKDVFSDTGYLLVGAGTTLSEFIISKLYELSIDSIQVLRQIPEQKKNGETKQKFLEKYGESVVLIKNLIADLNSGKNLELEEVEAISNILMDHFKESDMIVKFMQELRSADEYTFYHSINVAFYSMLIGMWLGQPRNEIQKIVQAGLLHDIGKVNVPYNILNKPERLTIEEYEIIKKHPMYGFEMLNKIEGIDSDIKHAVLYHHERMNRTGYPFKSSPEDIGLYPRIIAVADVFDAMTSNRVYKKRKTPFDAFEMFLRVGFSEFDISVLNTFLNQIPKYLVSANVLLSNGKIGQIVYVPPQEITKPIVSTESGFIDLSISTTIKIVEML
ncbi:HD-GYP domain-containing protein [Paenibacillus wynnii]|uniref:HD-GYP domain-containing protein n=1 Tax=Paenibacillus wynnii TaxID=268407 RepID=UPI00278F5EC1|nr:HD-GYP domain-containing protein [Paenibacillus wynnii]MDQ0192808.1 putative nucleotidyltransferase with HDIG domain [Paenibacillus wynnii]